jgi:hypothetical protein
LGSGSAHSEICNGSCTVLSSFGVILGKV